MMNNSGFFMGNAHAPAGATIQDENLGHGIFHFHRKSFFKKVSTIEQKI
jgi:hypothetical protein